MAQKAGADVWKKRVKEGWLGSPSFERRFVKIRLVFYGDQERHDVRDSGEDWTKGRTQKLSEQNGYQR